MEITSISKEDFQQRLREGVMHFFYNKADGSLREAFGTTDPELIEEHLSGEGKKRRFNPNSDNVVYFDFTANDWRSVNYDRFRGFDINY